MKLRLHRHLPREMRSYLMGPPMQLRLTATLLTDDATEIALAESIIAVDGAIKLKPLIAEVQTDLNAVAMSLLTKHERRRKPVGVE